LDQWDGGFVPAFGVFHVTLSQAQSISINFLLYLSRTARLFLPALFTVAVLKTPSSSVT